MIPAGRLDARCLHILYIDVECYATAMAVCTITQWSCYRWHTGEKYSIRQLCGIKRRPTNVLTGGGLKAMKEQCLGVEIVHVCFVEIGDSVLAVFCLELFQAKLLDE